MPFPSAPPTFAQTTDPNKTFTAGMSNLALSGSIAAGMSPSSADVEFLRRMREVRISRGEDPSKSEFDLLIRGKQYTNFHKTAQEMHA
jgi:hypothetical protein